MASAVAQIFGLILVAIPYALIRLVDRATGRYLQNAYWSVADRIHSINRWTIPAFFMLLFLFFYLAGTGIWAAVVFIAYGGHFALSKFADWKFSRKMRALAADDEKFAIPWTVFGKADNVEISDWENVVGVDAGRCIGLFGSPGSGKTEVIKHLLYQMCLTPADQPIVVLDLKNEFQEILNKWGVPNTVISGAEHTDFHVNIFAEARSDKTEADLEEISRSMFPSSMGGGFFETGARQVFVAVLKHLHRQGKAAGVHPDHSDIVHYFKTSTRDDCYEDLEQYDDMAAALTLLDPDAERQASGIYASLQQNIEEIFRASFRDSGYFSVREYINNPEEYGVIILDFPADLSDSVMPMYRVLLDWGIKHGRIDDKHVHFLMDEFAQVPHLRQIEELLNMGRGEDATAILALQSIGQLNENYSSDITDSLSSGLASKVILGLSDPATANFAMDLIGDEWGEQEKAKRGWTGEITGRTTDEVPEQPFVTSELQSWDKGEGVILPPGSSYIHGRNRLLTQGYVNLWSKGAGISLDARRGAYSSQKRLADDAHEGADAKSDATPTDSGSDANPDAKPSIEARSRPETETSGNDDD